ncbi:S-layer homology domain-containing protein [Ammoniphilus resinae]|uniref:SLH domain-containing protein n=1 Tax=Ammoniphilus resinae TaxID=861532 RepID=A0ABS4GQA8_9BACL|nr:S-layer homology domain-containing protein [Ammoniphilus resinae]MBP1932050.1 hypothetical protein [Ammoniphilus resinae]
MKRKLLSLSLSSSLLAGALMGGSMAAAATNDSDSITRGEFIKTIVDQLQFPLYDSSITLPKDVKSESPYANAIRIMQERKVIYGFGDGTVRLENTLHKNEAYTIIARILGIDAEKAPEILAKDYGVVLENEVLSEDEARKAIEQALTSDPVAHEWVVKSSEEMEKQDSFKAVMQQNMNMSFNEKIPENNNQDSMTFSMNIEMAYKKDKGFHMVSTSKLPQTLPNGGAEMNIEQYLVPEGMFMKMVNPETNEEEWINMGNQMPFTFDQLMEMQKESVSYNQQMNNKYVFYRDLGSETVDGKTLHKVAYQGRFASMQEMMNITKDLISTPEMQQSLMAGPGMDNISMSGIMWIDETTKLPVKMTVSMNMDLQPSAEQPIKGMNMEMSGTYQDYNKVEDIVLPEAAKQAKTLELPSAEDVEAYKVTE